MCGGHDGADGGVPLGNAVQSAGGRRARHEPRWTAAATRGREKGCGMLACTSAHSAWRLGVQGKVREG